jgi:hypothetical protein
MELAKRCNLHIIEIEEFVKKFVFVRKEMCSVERHVLPVESTSPTSRVNRVREKIQTAMSRGSDWGFGPPIRNSEADKQAKLAAKSAKLNSNGSSKESE